MEQIPGSIDETGGVLFLKSGKWRWRVEATPRGEVLELVEPGHPANKMRVPLPFAWRQLSADEFMEIARSPEIRLWMDRTGILWRVAAVGPGTRYDHPIERRHLIFDSHENWAGIVAFPPPAELGDLTSEELRELRDQIRDFGGSRKGYRGPPVPAE